jgi:hypothetical protein
MRRTKGIRKPTSILLCALLLTVVLSISNLGSAMASPVTGPGGWEWQNPLPQGNLLWSVWGNSSSDVFAVGDAGTILHWDGTAWSAMSSGTSNSLRGVWGTSSSDVFALGSGGTIRHWNGTAWSAMSSGTTSVLHNVWGTSSSDVFAVGDSGRILHWDGTAWSAMSSGSVEHLWGVWGSSSSDVFAVGTGLVILHWNGTSWSAMSSGTGINLFGVWGTSSSDVFAVGTSGTIRHWDGTAWSAMSSGTSNPLDGVWGTSSSDVFAVGSGGTIRHWNGTAWSAMSSGTSNDLCGVWGTSSSDVFAVGEAGTILHWNGTAWSAMSSGTTKWLYGVWGTSSSDVFAVGQTGTILRWNGNAWSAVSSGTTYSFLDVWGNSSSDVFAMGEAGTIRHWDGTAWSAMSSGTTKRLNGVWSSSFNDVFAVGEAGTILHWDGASWSAMPSGTTTWLSGVWGTSSSDIFAVGDSGTIRHWDGTAWSAMSSGTSNSLICVWGTSSSDVFASGLGTILHWNGTAWSAMSSGTTEWLNGVWGTSPSDVFAVGGTTNVLTNTFSCIILHWNGTSWSKIASGTNNCLNDVWGSSSGDVFAVGMKGTILHYTVSLNNPPVANAGGPYVIDLGDSVTLDGSGSHDPDAGDYIVSYKWDLNNDSLADVVSTTPMVTVPAADLSAFGLGVGVHNITLKVTDNYPVVPLTATATTTLTIYDNAPAAIAAVSESNIGLGHVVQFDGAGSYSGDPRHTIVNYEWDYDYNSVVFVTDELGAVVNHSFLSVGAHMVALRVTDDNVPPKTAIATVIVFVNQTNQPPVAEAGLNQTVEQTSPGGAQVILDGSGSTDEGLLIPLTYTWIWPGGSAGGMNPQVSLPPGYTTITLTIYDGEFSASDTVDIIISDTTPPELNVGPDITCEAEAPEGTQVTLSPSACDICDLNPLITSTAPALFPMGTTIVTVTANDESGNSASQSLRVTITDTTPPRLILPSPPLMQVEATSGDGTPVSLPGPIVVDNGDAKPILTNDAPLVFPLGETTFTWTATDASGNEATGLFTVWVQDTAPPTITAPADVNVRQNNAGGAVIDSLGTPTVIDVVDPDPVVTNDAPSIFPLGVTTVFWTALDASGNSATAIQTITVTENHPPSADDQSVTTNEDTAKDITLTATDIDGESLTYVLVEGPLHGTLTGTAPTLTYNPAGDYSGADSFTFKANDGHADSNPATISITVNPVNDVPSFTKGTDQSIWENAGTQIVSGWATDIGAGPTNESGQALNFILTNDNSALFSVQPAIASDGTLSYTPATDTAGSATVTVTLQDNGGKSNGGVDTSAPQTFIITVNIPANSPPVADDQSVTVNRNISRVISLTATDADDDILTYMIVKGPDHGKLSNISAASVTYTPNTNYIGLDRFTFKANDGTADSNAPTVSITVKRLITTITVLTSSTNPSVLGNPVDFTAIVIKISLGFGVPTGTVQFMIDGVKSGDQVELTNGRATINSLSTLAFGNHSISAMYSGDNNFASSTSSNLIQRVEYATVTTLSSNLNPSKRNQLVTLKASVISVNGTPSGKVSFYDGNRIIGTVNLSGKGVATLSVSFSTTGSHTVRAVYNGNYNYYFSSASIIQVVNK